MSQSVNEHRAEALKFLRIAVVTVSDTRTIETDTSGALIVKLAEEAGHVIADRAIVPDEPAVMTPLLKAYRDRDDLHAVLMTGGTGVTQRDQTFETVSALLDKTMPGYGELFRMLSYAEIGTACMLSRAIGGVMGKHILLTMPGSRAAVELAMNKVILPEITHLVREARKGL